jgi:hypothetical protein
MVLKYSWIILQIVSNDQQLWYDGIAVAHGHENTWWLWVIMDMVMHNSFLLPKLIWSPLLPIGMHLDLRTTDIYIYIFILICVF